MTGKRSGLWWPVRSPRMADQERPASATVPGWTRAFAPHWTRLVLTGAVPAAISGVLTLAGWPAWITPLCVRPLRSTPRVRARSRAENGDDIKTPVDLAVQERQPLAELLDLRREVRRSGPRPQQIGDPFGEQWSEDRVGSVLATELTGLFCETRRPRARSYMLHVKQIVLSSDLQFRWPPVAAGGHRCVRVEVSPLHGLPRFPRDRRKSRTWLRGSGPG